MQPPGRSPGGWKDLRRSLDLHRSLGEGKRREAAWWQDPLGAAVADSSHPVSPDRIAAIADGFAANPMDFAHSEPDPAQGAIMVESVAKDLANIAQLAASDGMLSLLPMGLERDFPVSRFATACPTP